ncbi:hypothetical protein QBC34DRAFT_76952 [Podospora aff. communis PSN243]|uniref:Uncharacterized protein n=1 Tax=Podospora aff. communis PSN243 TaxID=3040156 RepID=A0AAV9GT43_9PEZI|nr:hypothetical protein QBC34DRAFT_76952 [Podospora aff. communis PSN243]
MSLLSARDIIPFPVGDNSSDTLIEGIHLNKTTLEFWNYTLFTNNTISNTSWCVLAFPPYTPSLILPNGTWINETWCYRPTNPIGQRGGIGIAFAVLYAIGLGLTLVVLNKHGKLHLPAEKRFYPIGRRWQWYWALVCCATAIVSLFTSIDVDRYFLPELPVILTSFFWYLMQMGAMALVWEAIRHWGSWMERQYIDPDPFRLSQDDGRAMLEFWVPLFFYLWWWLNFFLIIPRNWGLIERQRYPEQVILDAMPAATDARFKAASFCLVVCWLITFFYLRHSIEHYCPRSQGLLNKAVGFIRFTPLRFYFLLFLAAVIPSYQALVAWEFAWSPLNINGSKAAIFAGGYLPTLLLIYVQIIHGFITPNEDLELKRQRRVRGVELDAEMGIAPKPGWWRGVRRAAEGGGPNESMQDRIARNVREVQGRKPKPTAARNADASGTTSDAPQPPPADAVEMGPVSSRPLPQQTVDLLGPIAPGDFGTARSIANRYDGLGERTRSQRVAQHATSLLFPNSAQDAAAAARRREELMMDGPPPYSETLPPYVERNSSLRPNGLGRETSAASTTGSATGSINSPPQQIRSMLDV